MAEKITKDILIGELAAKHPEAVPKLFERGMHCVGCPMTSQETLEQGCKAHGMDDKQVKELVSEINKAVAEK